MNFVGFAALVPQLAPSGGRRKRSFPRKRESSCWVPASARGRADEEAPRPALFTGTPPAPAHCRARPRPSANPASRPRSWSSRRPMASRRCPTRSGTSRPRNAPAHNRRGQGSRRKRLRGGRQRKPIVLWSSSYCAEQQCYAAAARLPKRRRFSFCLSLRGGSLNSRAAVPPKILCLAFSDRNGRSQIVDGRSKSQCG